MSNNNILKLNKISDNEYKYTDSQGIESNIYVNLESNNPISIKLGKRADLNEVLNNIRIKYEYPKNIKFPKSWITSQYDIKLKMKKF